MRNILSDEDVWKLQTAGIFAGIALFFAGAFAWQSYDRSEAQAAYKVSLAQLRHDPANPNLRQQTLELGRAYRNASLDAEGVPEYDDIALMSDINKACGSPAASPMPAAAPPAPAAVPAAPASSPMLSVEERLARLTRLKARKLISEEEYRAKRKQILDEL